MVDDEPTTIEPSFKLAALCLGLLVFPIICLFSLFLILGPNLPKNAMELRNLSRAILEVSEQEYNIDSKEPLLIKAKQKLVEAIDYSPYSAALWVDLSHIEKQLGHKQQAEKAYRIALSLNPRIRQLNIIGEDTP